MALTVDNLEIRIESDSKRAISAIDELAKTLAKLKTAVGNANGLSQILHSIASGMKALGSVGKIKLTSQINELTKLQAIIPLFTSGQAKRFAENMGKIAVGIGVLSNLPKTNLGSVVSSLKNLDKVINTLDSAKLARFSAQMGSIANSLSKLNSVQKGNIGSVLSQLSKIPDIVKALDAKTIDDFAAVIKRLVAILKPLADEMDKVAKGFAVLPNRMKSAIKAANSVGGSNRKLGDSYNTLFTYLARTAAKFWTLYYSMQRIIDVLADAFNTSNEYIESLNLFTVSMGDATDAASEYALVVQNAMGIDFSEWTTNQGTFQRMATGFGISAEQANIMSQNLTQLAYDMSSFFNTDVETAMQKLQSGMSGQIKGLKAWGYNLSVAALQETALSLGIEQSVRTMTEAQKAQLRYITLIQRSNGVMGDMARTIATPSNSLRILGAQMKQLERAFGNIVSVLATRVIPYVQAFIELMIEGANHLANLMGFKLPEIDYSNLELAEDVMDDIDGSIEDTTEEAKALKKQLMGFDELNILKSDKGEEDKKSVNYDLGFKMPEYDFLAGLSNEYRARIDEIKEAYKEFGEVLSDLAPIAAGIAALFAFSWVAGAVKKFAKLKIVASVTTAIVDALAAGVAMFGYTGSVLKGLATVFTTMWASFKAFMTGLSPITKALITIIGLIVEFVTVKNAIYDLATGSATLGETLLKIVPICSAVGIALGAIYGPVGVAVTAVVGLLAAIKGYSDAENDMRAQLSMDTFYDDQGVKIDELADAYGNLMQKVIDAQEPILTIKDNLDLSKDSVENTTEKVINLATQFELGYKTIEETVPLIKAEFDKLYNDTLEVLNNEAELIYTALAGSTGKALEDMGFNLEEVGLLIKSVVNETTVEIERLKNENDELMASIEAGTAEDGAMQQYLDNAKKIAELSGVDTSELDNFKDALTNLIPDDINWETDDLSGIFDDVATSTKAAKDAIDEASGASIDALEHLKSLTVDPEEIKFFDDLIAAFEKNRDDKKQEIDDLASGFIGNLQTNLVKSAQDQYDAALENWDSMSWFKKLFLYHGDKELYIKEFLEDYNNNVVIPITDQMKTAFSDSLGEDATWADTAVQSMLDNLFSKEHHINSIDLVLTKSITDAIDEVLPEGMKLSGENAVDGLVEGIDGSAAEVTLAMERLSKNTLGTFDDMMRIHSPSVEMYARGEYMMQGLGNAISDGTVGVLASLREVLGSIERELATFVSNYRRTLDGISSYSASINIKPERLGFAHVEQYATGGFPKTGSMFIANEAGPELVGRIGNKTAVANNDQIISGIARAVYDAMMDAHEDSNGSSGGKTSRIIVQIGEKAVGEASVAYINGQIVQTGSSPIYS